MTTTPAADTGLVSRAGVPLTRATTFVFTLDPWYGITLVVERRIGDVPGQ